MKLIFSCGNRNLPPTFREPYRSSARGQLDLLGHMERQTCIDRQTNRHPVFFLFEITLSGEEGGVGLPMEFGYLPYKK